jgi:hypothetical protein
MLLVLTHLTLVLLLLLPSHNLIDNALEDWSYPSPPAKVFRAIYAYIEENWPKFSPAVRTSLQSRPLVPVKGRLVKASRLFLRLKEDLSPYLFEVPRAFGAFDR